MRNDEIKCIFQESLEWSLKYEKKYEHEHEDLESGCNAPCKVCQMLLILEIEINAGEGESARDDIDVAHEIIPGLIE